MKKDVKWMKCPKCGHHGSTSPQFEHDSRFGKHPLDIHTEIDPETWNAEAGRLSHRCSECKYFWFTDPLDVQAQKAAMEQFVSARRADTVIRVLIWVVIGGILAATCLRAWGVL